MVNIVQWLVQNNLGTNYVWAIPVTQHSLSNDWNPNLMSLLIVKKDVEQKQTLSLETVGNRSLV